MKFSKKIMHIFSSIQKNEGVFALYILLLLCSNISSAQTCSKAFHIVVSGSSTAAGDGASSYPHSWVGKFTDSLKNIDTAYVVDNLAVPGLTTYDGQPSNYQPPPGRPLPLSGHNITAALKLHPDALIINYPSNDVVGGFSIKEQKSNFKRMTKKAADNNVAVWISTPQPRNNLNRAQVKSQHNLLQWIESYYKEKSINFWDGLASSKDSILFKFNSGDGIHLNNKGHNVLYRRVVEEDIPDTLCAVNNMLPVAFLFYNTLQ